MNRIEKWLAKRAGVESTKVGEDLSCAISYAGAHDVTAPIAISEFEKIGVDTVFDKDRVFFVADHNFPPSSEQARNNIKRMQEAANQYGFRFFSNGEGVIHQVLYEYLQPKEGDLVVIADSHTSTCGGYGAMGVGVGSTELAAAMATGKLDLEVPQVINVILRGKLQEKVSGKDLILKLGAIYGTDYFTDRAIVFSGPGIDEFSIGDRMTICNMGTEIGSMITLFGNVDEEEDVYEKVIIDLNELDYQIAKPYSPANVSPLNELIGTKVNQVTIGSCTNGRLEDIEAVYEVFKGKQVAKDVTVLVFPASMDVQNEMDKRGWSSAIRKAGATILNPGCGPCFGAHQGLVTEDDVVLSTTNRNFPGRMGAKAARIYLASPYVAATAALAGEIIRPSEVV